MLDLVSLQQELHEWRQRNFPDTSGPAHQVLGVAEETGELAHAILKQSQGIRGSFEQHDSEMKDAVGDVTIYLMGLCSAKGWDFEVILEDTARYVLKRDWLGDPVEGNTQ
jgi:NTP pyrophosphatase (non-canonical NTP hydrolase)